jgi:hypothetical protein
MRFNVHHQQILASSKDSGFQGEADVMMIRSQPMWPVSLDLVLVWCFHTYLFRSVCREQKIGGEHAHVGQVKSCGHMEKNLALHLFLHPWSVSPPLSFVKFCIFWCSHMLYSQSSLAHDTGFSRVYVGMAEWLRVAICLLLLMLCFTLPL